MTLLHQAAQKAVEALRQVTTSETFYRDPRGDRAGPAIDALVSALQQQPEPVAKPSRVGEDGWRKLAESQAALLELANLAEDSAAELAAEIGANLPLERAIAGIDYFLTVKEDRRFIEGARADLMKLSEPPALQHQEEPREPVARSSLPDPLGCRACTHPDCGRYDGPRRVECRAMCDNACARPPRPLAASPSTTRQQEVGSGWKLVPVEPTPEMIAAYLRANDAYWKRTDELPTPPNKWRTGTPSDATAESYRAMLAAAPSTPEKARGVSPTFPRNVPMDPQAMRERAAGVPGTEGGA